MLDLDISLSSIVEGSSLWVLGEAGSAGLYIEIAKKISGANLADDRLLCSDVTLKKLRMDASGRKSLAWNSDDDLPLDPLSFDSVFCCTGFDMGWSVQARNQLIQAGAKPWFLFDHIWNVEERIARFGCAQNDSFAALCANEIVAERVHSLGVEKLCVVTNGSKLPSRKSLMMRPLKIDTILVVMDYFYGDNEMYEEGSQTDFDDIADVLSGISNHCNVVVRPHPRQMDHEVADIADSAGGVVSRLLPEITPDTGLIIGVDSQLLVSFCDQGFTVMSLRASSKQPCLADFYKGIFGFDTKESFAEGLNYILGMKRD